MDFLDFINKADTSDYKEFLRSRARDNARNYARSQANIFKSFFETYNEVLDNTELVYIMTDEIVDEMWKVGEIDE